MRYATEDAPLGTAGLGPQRVGRARRHLPRHLRRRAHRHRPQRVRRRAPRERARSRSIALKRVENPLEFGIVITRPDGSIERFLEKPTLGSGVLRHDQHRHLRARARRSSTSSPRVTSSTSRATCSRPSSTRACRLHGHVVEGYWEDVGTTEAYLRAHADVLDGRVQVDIAGFRIGEGVWLGEGAEVDPDARVDGPVVIGDNCRVEAGAQLCAVHRARHRRRREERRVPRARGLPRPRLRRAQRPASRAARSVGPPTCAATPASRKASSSATSASSASTRSSTRASRSTRSRRSRPAPSSTRRSCGRAAGRARSSAGGASAASPTSTSPPRSRCASRWPTARRCRARLRGHHVSRDTSRIARALKRAIIGGLNLAGANVEDLELATVPLTRFQVRNGQARGGSDGPARARTTPTASRSASSTPTGATSTRACNARSSGCSHREDYRRAFAGDIGDIMFPPRSIEFYTAGARALRRRASGLREHAFKVVLDYSYGAASIVMPTVLASSVPRCSRSTRTRAPRPATAIEARSAQVARIGELVRASGSHLGCRDRSRRRDCDDRRRRGHGAVAPPDDAGARQPRRRDPRARAIALPVVGHARGRADRDAHGAPRSSGRSWSDARPHGGGLGRGGSRSRASTDGGFIWPDFLPAYDALATLANLLDLLAATGRSLSSVVNDPAARAPRARDGADAVGAQGHGDARAGGARAEPAISLLVDGVKVERPRRMGPRAPGPRAAAHPRVGRGRHRPRGRAQPRPGVQPAGSAKLSASVPGLG